MGDVQGLLALGSACLCSTLAAASAARSAAPKDGLRVVRRGERRRAPPDARCGARLDEPWDQGLPHYYGEHGHNGRTVLSVRDEVW